MLALYTALLLTLQAPLPPAIDAMPPAPVPDLTPLLPDAPWRDGPALPAFAPARDHKRALLEDPLHGERFWVEELAGDPESRRVVFLIPQFHRNPLVPIEWTTLGEAIALVQSNIDALVTRLAVAHGVGCVGTEGSWLNDIRLPYELRQPAQWREDLARRRRVAHAVLAREAPGKRTHASRVERLLVSGLERRVALYDGVGVALYRLQESDRRVRRFGLEDEQLNKRALLLLAKLQRIDEALAELDPGGQTDVQTAMGRMWLEEIEAYEREVLAPLDESLAALDEERLRLRGDGAEDAADDLGRFVVLAKLVASTVLRADDVRAYTDHYRRLASGDSDDAGPSSASPRELTSWEQKRRQRLRAERAPLQREYEAVSIDERERRAAQKVLAQVSAGGGCALVMGAVHKDALRARLLELGGDDVAVIVVAPYSFDEGEPADAQAEADDGG